MVNNATLVQTVETVSDPALVTQSGEIWRRLQNEKLEICRSLRKEARVFTVSANTAEELEWLHRERMETRLRQLTDAQDRLLEGYYGSCVDCDEEIVGRRLAADPAAALCFACQSAADRKQRFYSL